MENVLITCETVRREIEKALSETDCAYRVIWLEAGLHSSPERLRTRLQLELDQLQDTGRVVFAMGYCGNAMLGLRSRDFHMVLPRVDDCITLVLGSLERRKSISREMGTYFITKGWLEQKDNIWADYQAMIEKYGEEESEIIYEELLKHYKRLLVIDTECFDIEEFCAEAAKIAEGLHLKIELQKGNLNTLKNLLSGPWENSKDFLCIAPNQEIVLADLI